MTRVVALKPNVIDLGESPAAAAPPPPPPLLEGSQPAEQPALSPLWLSLQLLRGVLVLAKSAALAPVAAQLTAALDVLARLLRIRAPLLHASVVLLAVHVLRGTAVAHADGLAHRRTEHALHAASLLCVAAAGLQTPKDAASPVVAADLPPPPERLVPVRARGLRRRWHAARAHRRCLPHGTCVRGGCA